MSSRRSETTWAILGPYKEIDNRQLPTIRDAIKFILFVKNDLKLKFNGMDPSNSDIYIWGHCIITSRSKVGGWYS